jgi:hypothetical protein
MRAKGSKTAEHKYFTKRMRAQKTTILIETDASRSNGIA